MAGRIPQQFIDELISRVDIVEVIDARVPLRKTGRDYTARCPFHEEKSPSFTVSPTKQFYHCFGCQAHGTAISFLMEYEHLDFIEAVHELANKVGLEVPKSSGPDAVPAPPNTELYDILEQATRLYREQLREHPVAVDYLKQRGLTGAVAAEFAIGYAPPGWDTALQNLGKTGRSQQSLLEAGLLIKKDQGGYYDRFRNRIMFPIRDRRGRVIGFGGRVLDKDGTPKYLNSPETPVFHKGNELYGLYEAQQALRRLERLLVVEGYMDVVALAQNGIHYAVATLGTATTPEHVERLFRAAPELIFCFDGDRAGREAAWRAVEHALPNLRDGRQARVIFLPEGDDPDSLVRREGREQFEQRIAQSVPISTFYYEGLLKQTDISSMEGRARLVELARPMLSKLNAGVLRHMMITKLAELTHLDVNALSRMLAGNARPVTTTTNPPSSRPPHTFRSGLTPLRLGISLLLHAPKLAPRAGNPQRWSGLTTRGINLWISILELLQATPHLTGSAILEHWRGTKQEQLLTDLAMEELAIPADGYDAEFLGIVRWLDGQLREQRWAYLHDKCQREGLSGEEKREFLTFGEPSSNAPH